MAKIKKQKKVVKKKKALKKIEFVNFAPIDKSIEAAIFYGFTPTNAPKPNKNDSERASELKDNWSRHCPDMPWVFSQDFILERIAFIREHHEKGMTSQPQPILQVYESDSKKERGKTSFNLEIIGSTKSIAEAMLIKTSVAILADNGYDDLFIEINSIGDKESANKFARELTNYYKKNLNELTPHCRQNFKKDPFYVLPCSICDFKEIKEGSPTSVSCLSDESRNHFKEVLEYLELIKLPYKINNCLVHDRKYCSQTIFEIKNAQNEKEVLAVGFRYDGLAHKLGYKKDAPGIGLKIFLKKKAVVKKVSKLKKPKAFYIQLGDEAKHKSLEVVELLRKNDIFVYHMLGRDKLGSQFAQVEKTKVPYVIIMGKKEFLDNTVMVRENITRNQETIPIERLPEYLNKLKG